jgi:hypothetical protein
MWIVTSEGELSCVDPQTGAIRASEHLTAGNAPIPLGADSGVGTLLAQGPSGQLQTVTPPNICW